MMPSDNAEDCFSFGCKVIWGITDALKNEAKGAAGANQMELLDKLVKGDALQALLCVLNFGIKDDGVLDLVFKSIQNISSLGIKADSTVSS